MRTEVASNIGSRFKIMAQGKRTISEDNHQYKFNDRVKNLLGG